MEKVVLNNVQLDYLAFNHPHLGKLYEGTRACDALPATIAKEGKKGLYSEYRPTK